MSSSSLPTNWGAQHRGEDQPAEQQKAMTPFFGGGGKEDEDEEEPQRRKKMKEEIRECNQLTSRSSGPSAGIAILPPRLPKKTPLLPSSPHFPHLPTFLPPHPVFLNTSLASTSSINSIHPRPSHPYLLLPPFFAISLEIILQPKNIPTMNGAAASWPPSLLVTFRLSSLRL
jgi:hypothetical protein